MKEATLSPSRNGFPSSQTCPQAGKSRRQRLFRDHFQFVPELPYGLHALRWQSAGSIYRTGVEQGEQPGVGVEGGYVVAYSGGELQRRFLWRPAQVALVSPGLQGGEGVTYDLVRPQAIGTAVVKWIAK